MTPGTMDIIDLMYERFAVAVLEDPGTDRRDAVARALSETHPHSLTDAQRLVLAFKTQRTIKKLTPAETAAERITYGTVRTMVEDGTIDRLDLTDEERAAMRSATIPDGKRSKKRMTGLRLGESAMAVVTPSSTLLVSSIKLARPIAGLVHWISGERKFSAYLVDLMRSPPTEPAVIMLFAKPPIKPEMLAISMPGRMVITTPDRALEISTTIVDRLAAALAGQQPRMVRILRSLFDARQRSLGEASDAEAAILKLMSDAGIKADPQKLADLFLDASDTDIDFAIRLIVAADSIDDTQSTEEGAL